MGLTRAPGPAAARGPARAAGDHRGHRLGGRADHRDGDPRRHLRLRRASARYLVEGIAQNDDGHDRSAASSSSRCSRSPRRRCSRSSRGAPCHPARTPTNAPSAGAGRRRDLIRRRDARARSATRAQRCGTGTGQVLTDSAGKVFRAWPVSSGRTHTEGDPMRLSRTLALGATMLVLAVSACSSGGGSSKPTVKIGSVGFDEAKIMAEVYAQVLENDGLHRQPRRHRARRPQGAPAGPRERPDRPPAGVHRLAARVEGVRRHADRRPGREPDRAPGDPQRQGWRASPSSTTRRRRTRTRSSSARRRPTSTTLTKMSDLTAVQDKLKFGLATDCPTNPRVRRGPQGRVRHRHVERDAARRRATRRWRRRWSPRPSTSASSARRSRTSS